MFKTLIRFSVALLLLTSSAFAQNNPFVGKWELVGVSKDAGYSYQKLFNEGGDFSNYRVTADGVVKTHFGKYIVKDKTTYLEVVSTETDESRSHVAGQTTTILYKFSEDKKLLTIKGLAINGNSDFEETWKRVDVPVVTAIPLKLKSAYQ